MNVFLAVNGQLPVAVAICVGRATGGQGRLPESGQQRQLGAG